MTAEQQAAPADADSATADSAAASPGATDTGDSADSADPGRPSAAERVERSRSSAYRRRAQEAETAHSAAVKQIAALTDTIAGFQRADVERAVTAAGVKPAAVWAVADLADLLGDDHRPDPARVDAAIRKARDELGIPTATVRDARRGGLHSGAAGETAPAGDGWAAAFAPPAN